MWTVFLSLIPTGIAGIIIFGKSAFFVICISIATAVTTEAAVQIIRRQRIAISDGSAALTGLLLAYNLPSGVPLWIPIAGSLFAVLVGKQLFGGLGRNIFNPALVGRAFLLASWPKYMTKFPLPFNYDGVTSATPLIAIKEGSNLFTLNYLDLFMGNRGGCIGEVSIVFLIIGAVYLLCRGYISWHIPFSYIFTVGFLSWVF
jgi:electron transport complex protein RnfD